MTSDKIHNIAKAFFYTWLVLAAIVSACVLVNIISHYVMPEAIGFTLTFCWIWVMCYIYVDARAKSLDYKKDISRRLSIRTDGKIGD